MTAKIATSAATPLDDRRLIERALAGEPEAVEVLVKRLMQVIHARVRRQCLRARQGTEDLDDLVQEIWLKLLADGGARLSAFDPARSASLEGYVGVIAEHEASNLLRLRTAKKRGGHLTAIQGDDLPAQSPGPEESVEAGELAARLGEHLEQALPPRGLLIFRYAFTDQREPDEVAKMLGVTVQVVYNWQHKIRAAARAFLSAL